MEDSFGARPRLLAPSIIALFVLASFAVDQANMLFNQDKAPAPIETAQH